MIPLAILAWGALYVTRADSNLQKISPTEPNSDSGQVYPLDSHGHIVYLTEQQNSDRNDSRKKFEIGFFVVIGLAGLEDWVSGKLSKPKVLDSEASS